MDSIEHRQQHATRDLPPSSGVTVVVYAADNTIRFFKNGIEIVDSVLAFNTKESKKYDAEKLGMKLAAICMATTPGNVTSSDIAHRSKFTEPRGASQISAGSVSAIVRDYGAIMPDIIHFTDEPNRRDRKIKIGNFSVAFSARAEDRRAMEPLYDDSVPWVPLNARPPVPNDYFLSAIHPLADQEVDVKYPSFASQDHSSTWR